MSTKLIVGLGNPGTEYALTRHNAGFMVIDRLVHRHSCGPAKAKFHSRAFEARIDGAPCWLIEPMTFMNRSGLAVGEAVRFFKLDPETDLMVVVDDVALPLGRLRVRGDGGSGGHNGLRDIERVLGTQRYPRIRIGIDASRRGGQTGHVLGRFANDELDTLEPLLGKVCDAVDCWVGDGIDRAMNRFNIKNDEA